MKQPIIAISAIFREVAIPLMTLACLITWGSTDGESSRARSPIIIPPDQTSTTSVTPNGTAGPVSFDDIAKASSASPLSPEAKVSAAETSLPSAGSTDQIKTSAFERPGDSLSNPSIASLPPTDFKEPESAAESQGDCALNSACVDQYLFALYENTPKEDAVERQEEKKVTIRKKGKLAIINRKWMSVIEEDFSWKDPKAADRAGMSLPRYVIGGIDASFKQRLFRMLHAAEDAGLSPGITSGFRDDYRQSIASGLKAANNRSYHGGSLRGGYGHGLAADIVSTNGKDPAQRLVSSRLLWNWIDAHGREFGIGRPYLNRDPPHVAPIDGQEYADHRLEKKVQQAGAARTQKGATQRTEHRATKRAGKDRPSKQKTT